MSNPGDVSLSDGSAAPPQISGEFSLRPLRIQKRHSTPEKRSKPDRPEKQEQPRVASRKSAGSDDFVCRPMRLGSASTPQSFWAAETGDSKPAIVTKHEKSGGKDTATATQDTGFSHDAETLAESVQNSALESPPTFLSRHPSIQIKNLPIVQSPRKFSSAGPPGKNDPVFAVCLVDFHHVRGPEVQWWRSNYHRNADPALFRNLAFQALPDGSHLFEETFSNFNLVYDFEAQKSLDDSVDIESFRGNPNHLETLFGCSCVRQVKTADLSETELERNKDITRSIVQKAVVVISRKQPVFTKIKEKLSIITHSFFQQDTFGNYELLDNLFDNLNELLREPREEESTGSNTPVKIDPESQLEADMYEEQEEYFVNLNLRELLAQLKNDLLIILKALLLEKRVVVYSNNNLELLTQFQNNMIALIPNLINNLELSGCPLCDYTEKNSPLEKPTSLKTNDRMSMLRFFGLPLQVFNTKGGFWNPYLPLQQMDELKATSFMVGCSNLLIVNQSARFKIDVLVNLDTWSVTYPMGKPEELRLTTLDKKFVFNLLAANSTGEAYIGSDDYIRYQFEDYIRSLLSTVRFQQYVERFQLPPPGFDPQVDRRLGSYKAFNIEFVSKWQSTKNYQIWNSTSDEFIFNFHPPTHFATEMTDSGGAYNFGGFLSSFRKTTAVPASNLAERANQYFSHAQQPRKFIENEDKEKDSKPAAETTAAKSGWWGFKKT